MNAKNVSIGTIIAVLALIAAIWKFDDRYAKASDFGSMKKSIERIETNQSTAMEAINRHLEFERQQAIYETEKELRILDSKDNLTPSERADREELIRRLDSLRK